jgi:hypothetical protein
MIPMDYTSPFVAFHEKYDRICMKCGERATHLEMLELDFPMYLCLTHWKEWVSNCPTKTDEYPDTEVLNVSLADERALEELEPGGFFGDGKDSESICFDCGSSAKLTKIDDGVVLCDECLHEIDNLDTYSPAWKTEIKEDRGCPSNQLYCPPWGCKTCITNNLARNKERS